MLHPIVVDDREKTPPPEQTVAALVALGVPAKVGHLPDNGGGDMRWVVQPQDEGDWLTVVVERKSINDLLASTRDERLGRFVSNDTGPSVLKVLLVEGNQFQFAQWGARDWSPEQLDDLLASVQTQGVVVIHSKSASETPRRIQAFWRWTGKDNHGSYLRPTMPETRVAYISDRERDAVRNLMTLPGWGEPKARATWRGLGSLKRVYEAIINRDYRAFDGVRGVGKGMVDNAASLLEEEFFGA